MRNANYEYEEEINLITLFLYALKHWRRILIGLLIGGLFGAGLAAAGSLLEKRSDVVEGTLEEAEAASSGYVRLQLAEEMCSTIESNMDALATHMRESRLMQMDPYDMYQGSLVYRVEAPVKNLESIRTAVEAYAMEGALYQELEKDLGFYSVSDLEQLNSVLTADESTVEMKVPNPGNDAGVLCDVITIKAQTEEEASQLLAQAADSLDVYIKSLDRAYGVKAYDVQSMAVIAIQDMDLAEYQDNIRLRADLERETLSTFEKELAAAKASVESVAEEPSEEPNREGVSVKTMALYAVVGSFLGCAAVIGYYSLAFLLGGKLCAVSNPEGAYGVPVLGRVHDLSELKGLDLWIAQKLCGIYSGLPKAEQLKIVLLNIKNQLQKIDAVQTVLLVSSLGDAVPEAELLKTGLEATGYEVLGCENVIGRADVLEQASRCQAAVVIESFTDSKAALVKEEVEVLRQYLGQVVGMIVAG